VKSRNVNSVLPVWEICFHMTVGFIMSRSSFRRPFCTSTMGVVMEKAWCLKLIISVHSSLEWQVSRCIKVLNLEAAWVLADRGLTSKSLQLCSRLLQSWNNNNHSVSAGWQKHLLQTAYHQVCTPLTYLEVKCHFAARLYGSNSRVK